MHNTLKRWCFAIKETFLRILINACAFNAAQPLSGSSGKLLNSVDFNDILVLIEYEISIKQY
jgi:hypothetical protein